MKYKNKRIYLILIILFLATSLLGIGYAQIADVDFNVVGDAQLEGQG